MPVFRVGQKVKVRSEADNEFAGCTGVTVFIQDTVCDVRITYHPTNAEMPETLIEVFDTRDLEHVPPSARRTSVVD